MKKKVIVSNLTNEVISEALDNKWNELENLGSQKRILPTHPLKLYVSRTQARNRVFQFAEGSDFQKFKDIKFRSLEFHTGENGASLSIELTDEAYSSTYIAFLFDLVSKTAPLTKESAAQHLISRLKDWSKFFNKAPKEGLSESEALGLRGELSLLRDFLKRTEKRYELIESWRGPNGDKSDIGWGSFRIEIKTKRATSKSSVQINSIDQLAENPGQLYLYVGQVNPGAENGRSITDLVGEIQKMIGNDPVLIQLLEAKLILARYSEQDPACDVLYQEVGANIYKVVESFPKITPSQIPANISKVVYELELGQLGEYLVESESFWDMVHN